VLRNNKASKDTSPWVGKVTKSNKSSVNFECIVRQTDGTFQFVLAKIKGWDDLGGVPDGLWERIISVY
jgi:hypothetical protein